MDTLTTNSNQSEQNFNDLISAGVVNVDTAYAVKNEDTLAEAKQFLDRTFPLARGSHKDVSSYVVYYQQLLMFFTDGTHSGLCDPSQFVALSGRKSEPEAILLKNKGIHVELSFDSCGKTGAKNQSNIEDIQLEGAAYWISLLNIEEKRVVLNSPHSQLFTAKDGSDYQLKNR